MFDAVYLFTKLHDIPLHKELSSISKNISADKSTSYGSWQMSNVPVVLILLTSVRIHLRARVSARDATDSCACSFPTRKHGLITQSAASYAI